VIQAVLPHLAKGVLMNKLKFAYWIDKKFGEDFGGNSAAPGSTAELNFGEMDGARPMYVARTYPNDGHDLWLGTPEKWHVFYSEKEARRLAWFILWDWWAVSTWFGLKRKIWFWALGVIVKSYSGRTPLALDASPQAVVKDKSNIGSRQ
jgi:hypothetical protein